MTTRPVMTLVLWDVDHTLIENGGVSKENYALTYELLTGVKPEVQPSTDGRTDATIMAALFEANGRAESDYRWDDTEQALIEAAARNRGELTKRGHVLPGAEACLARLADMPDVKQSTLTGNVVANARVKLGAFNLDR